MWKLWHRIFGWDYVLVEHGYSNYVKRVQYTPNNNRYVTFFGEIYPLDKCQYCRLT